MAPSLPVARHASLGPSQRDRTEVLARVPPEDERK